MKVKEILKVLGIEPILNNLAQAVRYMKNITKTLVYKEEYVVYFQNNVYSINSNNTFMCDV